MHVKLTKSLPPLSGNTDPRTQDEREARAALLVRGAVSKDALKHWVIVHVCMANVCKECFDGDWIALQEWVYRYEDD
jgi:hypothetical protein